MTCSRRQFLKEAMGGSLVSALPLSAFVFLTTEEARAAVAEATVRWGFLVDTNKCTGCGFCVKACKTENEVPYDAPVTRTWVERYVVTRDGQTHIDSPLGGRDGFIDDKIQDQEIDPEEITKAFFVPKLCNQCDNPACVQSCAFGARQIANLRDPDDPVTKIITTERVAVLKDEYGTKPHVFYLGLDENVR